MYLLVGIKNGALVSGLAGLGNRVLVSLSLDLKESGLVTLIVMVDLKEGGLASSSIGLRESGFVSRTIGLRIGGLTSLKKAGLNVRCVGP